MYLYRKNYATREDVETIKEAITGKKSDYMKKRLLPKNFTCPEQLKKVLEKFQNMGQYEEQLKYWRKANQIHGWFVKHCKSIDDDIEIEVTYEDLENLLEDIKKVLTNVEWVNKEIDITTGYDKNGKETKERETIKVLEDTSVAEKLLPTTEGFFFGSYEYDEYYIEQLKETEKALTEIIKNSEEYDDFVYEASY